MDAITAQVRTLPAQLRASLTWDRGMELADHRKTLDYRTPAAMLAEAVASTD